MKAAIGVNKKASLEKSRPLLTYEKHLVKCNLNILFYKILYESI